MPPRFFELHFYPHAACVTTFSQRTSFLPSHTKNGSPTLLLTTYPIPQNLPKSIPSIALKQPKFSTLNLTSILFCLLSCLLNHPFSPVSSTSPSTYLPSTSSLSLKSLPHKIVLPPSIISCLPVAVKLLESTIHSIFLVLQSHRFKHSSRVLQTDFPPSHHLYLGFLIWYP